MTAGAYLTRSKDHIFCRHVKLFGKESGQALFNSNTGILCGFTVKVGTT